MRKCRKRLVIQVKDSCHPRKKIPQFQIFPFFIFICTSNIDFVVSFQKIWAFFRLCLHDFECMSYGLSLVRNICFALLEPRSGFIRNPREGDIKPMNFCPIKGYFFASYTFRAINGPIVPQKSGKKQFFCQGKYVNKSLFTFCLGK